MAFNDFKRILVNILHHPLVMLWTVPTGIVLSIGVLPLVIVWLEREFIGDGFTPFAWTFSVESARTALSVVAAGAITALSLTYSLVLVVFTLAAGNIGPRLLKRFTSEIVNQVTAGILGGTFLYALIALLFINPDFMPRFTIMGAVLLGVLSVLQLIYFVRHVSQSIMIDDEVAQITARLSRQFEALQSRASKETNVPDADECDFEIKVGRSGYIGFIDEASLIECAENHDMIMVVAVASGGFIIESETLMRTTKELDDDTVEKLRSYIEIDTSRSAHQSVGFSINLLVEIALRALSPGVNDTFTAVAVANSLSDVFARIAENEGTSTSICDKSDNVRLVLPGLSVKQMIGQAFHPLRRASSDNILMAQSLARAFTRLYGVGGTEMKKIIKMHTELLIEELTRSKLFDHDIESVREYLPKDLKQEIS